MEKKIHELITREGSMDNISIIIRNKNEEQHIGYAIQSCLDFFEKPEIIIVDNDSRDNSLDVVMFFNDRTDIKIINNKNYTPGKALNIGVKNASRDYVMILSAHSKSLNWILNRLRKN